MDGPSRPMPRASIGGTVLLERSGWCLKKSKSDRSWAKAHHSHRYFVSRGHALCYYERQAPTPQEGGLKGVIDLREVKRIRPSADPTAPELALDLVMSGRTYVLVPQPATAAERLAWIRTWAPNLHAEAIAPELWDEDGGEARKLANLQEQTPSTPPLFSSSSSGGTSNRSSLSSSAPGRPAAAATSESAAGGSGDAGGEAGGEATPRSSSFAWPAPKVLMKGYLQKMPVRSDRRRAFSAVSLLGDLAPWKRRYFLLRQGMLQWFSDDPGADGEFLGVLRLTAETTIELERGSARLKVSALGETLILKDEGGESLSVWEQALRTHVLDLANGGGAGGGAGGGEEDGGEEGAAAATTLDLRMGAVEPDDAGAMEVS